MSLPIMTNQTDEPVRRRRSGQHHDPCRGLEFVGGRLAAGRGGGNVDCAGGKGGTREGSLAQGCSVVDPIT